MNLTVITMLCFAAFALVVTLMVVVAPRCGPTSKPGPTIGGVIMIAGCPR